VALLLQSDAGLTSEQAEAVVPQILAAVNLLGPKLCTCLHVDGWSDPAHGHGYYQCETCGGLCCSERWVGHEVMGLRWMELMMQHHRHSQVVVRGLNFIQERMLGAIEVIARTVPPERQKAVVRRLVETELGNLSHIWFQSVMGDYLYQTGETRGGPTTPRIYEESAERLVEKLHALKSGCTPEEFRASYDEPPYDVGVRDTGGRVTLAIHALPKPGIAAINGPAVGIGATMTLAMDLRLASTKAKIGFVFGRLGIVPEACSTWFLPRLVGPQQALEWIYSADVLTADQALAGGLLRSVHEPDELLPTALELARSFVVDRSPVALALAKQMVSRNGAAPPPLEAHLSDSLAMYWTSLGDGKEGVAAFREKRTPVFTRKASQAPRIYPS